LLANSVQRYPDKIAIVDGHHHYTYAELGRQARALAEALLDEGVRPGDRVGVYLDKSWEAVVAVFAISQTGAAFVNINPLLKERQVRHIVSDAGIGVLLTSAGKLQGMSLPEVHTIFYAGEDMPVPMSQGAQVRCRSMVQVMARPTDSMPLRRVPVPETGMATILYTSGSTGLPKGIMWSQHNLVVGAQIVSTYLENTADDRVLSVLPFSFDYGLNQLTTMVRVGGTLVLQRSSLPGEILRSLRDERITGLAGIPPVWVLLLQNHRALREQPLQCLRYITNSGGMVPQAHIEQLRRLLPYTKIYLMYGLTEAFRSTYLPPEELERRPTSMGKAIPNTEIWVLNERGEHCKPGEVGELVHRGPTVAMGYWGNPEATARVYRSNPFLPPQAQCTEKVVYSGDLVRMDEDGFLYYVGRRDEQIKSEGYRMSPQEIEELLYTLPGIKEAVAFGVPEPSVGQRVAVVVSLQPDRPCTEDDIRQHFRVNAPPYMMPKFIEIWGELPKTPTGKIDRPAVKSRYVSPLSAEDA
jgi:acyl-CoA ligase (AMP-forming) (exosortase A-associated)